MSEVQERTGVEAQVFPETDPDQLRKIRDIAAMGLDVTYKGLSGEVLAEVINRELWRTGDIEAGQQLYESADKQYQEAMSAYDAFLINPNKTKDAVQNALTNVFVAMRTARLMYCDGFEGTVSRLATAHRILLDQGLYEGKIKARISEEEIDTRAFLIDYDSKDERAALLSAQQGILYEALYASSILIDEGVPGAREDFPAGFKEFLKNATRLVNEAPISADQLYSDFNTAGEAAVMQNVEFDFNSAEVTDFLWAVARTNVRFMPGEVKIAVMNALADLLDQDPENYDYQLRRRKLEKHVNGLANCVNGNYHEYTPDFRQAFRRLTGKDVFTLLDTAQKMTFLKIWGESNLSGQKTT
jgi:hypothetical protein